MGSGCNNPITVTMEANLAGRTVTALPRLPKAPLPLCGWQLQPGENRQSGEAANPIPTNAAIDTTDKNAFVKISSAGWMRAASGTGGGGPG